MPARTPTTKGWFFPDLLRMPRKPRRFMLDLVDSAARRVRGESGQALVEYALLLSLIAIVCFGVVDTMGLGLSSLYSTINARFP
jgi:Flp pilus assembly pilin Flp